MTSRHLESTVLAAVAILIAAVFISLVRTADHPAAAAGIALQTLAGFFAAVQLWANNASDAMVNWVARQIDSNRWHVAGLLDGRLPSLSIATGWILIAYIATYLPRIWSPSGIVVWPIGIVLLANFLAAALAFFLALFMYAAARLVAGEPLPDGEASTALQARLAGNAWVWPFVAFAFLVGGILQIASA